MRVYALHPGDYDYDYGTGSGITSEPRQPAATRPSPPGRTSRTRAPARTLHPGSTRLRDIARGLTVPYVHRAAGDSAAPMLQKATPVTLDRTGDSLEGRTELYWLLALAAFLLALRETLLVLGRLRELRPVRSASQGAAPAATKSVNA